MDQKEDKGFIAAYLKLSRNDLTEKIIQAEKILKNCTLCPRKCRVDRTAGGRGSCKTGDRPVVSNYNPHFGEESPLVGSHGSGTIFFTRCNLGCLFCQNWTISHLGEGSEMSFDTLADIMMVLQRDYSCHNINFVTPTHQVPMILKSLEIAIDKGLHVPLVYNCGGYEALETLKILDGIVDIYMPDFKYADPGPAETYSKAKDYPETAKVAIKEMHRQVGDLVMNESGIGLRGLLVRHLVLPEGLAGTEEVVRFLAEEISPDTYTNIMAQYYPCYRAAEHPPLDRRITNTEYRKAVMAARRAELKRLDYGACTPST
ncbi:MAG: radical SAM protein [Nitrospiraceae bacterium]|nr:MAG: radical SAM protein [Nitrospiraceae bacterium]